MALRKRSATSSNAARYMAVLPAGPDATSTAICLVTSANTGEPVAYSTPFVTLPPAAVNRRRTDAASPWLPASARQHGTIV